MTLWPDRLQESSYGSNSTHSVGALIARQAYKQDFNWSVSH